MPIFPRSLLDVFTDTNETSPTYVMKAFTLLGLCSILDRSEIHALAETLPSECNFLHRPGLVNLMPSSLREMISIERDEHYEQQDDEEEENEEQNIPVRRGVLIRPIDLNDPSSGDATSSRDHGTPFFSLPSSLLIEDDDVYRHATAVEVPETPPHRFTTASTPSSPSQIPFEQLLQQIVHRRVNESNVWIQQQISTIATSQAYYLASGGDLSDNTVASVCALGVVGTAVVLSTSSSWIRRKYPTIDDILKTLPLTRSTDNSYNNVALGYTSTIALVSGGMWIVRQINRTDNSEIMDHIHPSNQSNFITLSKRFWDIMKSFFNPNRWRMMGLELFYENPIFIYLVVAAWSLTALFAWKLRGKIRSMKWIFQSIFAKLMQHTSEWRQTWMFGHSSS